MPNSIGAAEDYNQVFHSILRIFVPQLDDKTWQAKGTMEKP